jgi:RNA polymerase sigma-70 factor (ECF subfamily)
MADTVVTPDEAGLVERARHDPEAFLKLYDRHVNGLYRFAFYRLGNRTEAEDVVSQTFLQVMRYLDRYEQRGIPFRHWLYRIAARIIASTADHQRREVLLAVGQFNTGAGDPDALPERLDLAALLRTLPAAQQQVLVLRYVQDLSLRDVARIIGRSEGAVKQLAWRGLRTLRERMVEHES